MAESRHPSDLVRVEVALPVPVELRTTGINCEHQTTYAGYMTAEMKRLRLGYSEIMTDTHPGIGTVELSGSEHCIADFLEASGGHVLARFPWEQIEPTGSVELVTA